MAAARVAKASTSPAAAAGAAMATTTGARPVPSPAASASATTRALLSCGITEASIADQVVVSAGAATASMTAAVVAATRPGRRITAWASRNQRPSAARVVAAARQLRAPEREERRAR